MATTLLANSGVEFEELVGSVPTGRVDDDVGHAHLGVCPLPQGVDLGGVGDVHRQRRDQLGLLLGGGGCRRLVEVRGDHPVALRGERQRYRLANARSGAGHHREPAV